MKNSCFSININKNKNHAGFSCQEQSFSERNFHEALLLEKEINK